MVALLWWLIEIVPTVRGTCVSVSASVHQSIDVKLSEIVVHYHSGGVIWWCNFYYNRKHYIIYFHLLAELLCRGLSPTTTDAQQRFTEIYIFLLAFSG